MLVQNKTKDPRFEGNNEIDSLKWSLSKYEVEMWNKYLHTLGRVLSILI